METCREEVLLGNPLIFCITLLSQICQDPQRIFALSLLFLSNDTTALYLSFIASIANELFFRLDVRKFRLNFNILILSIYFFLALILLS